MNYFYASWIYHLSIVQDIDLQDNKCDRLGDLVETGLGVLYLATIFPDALSEIVREPLNREIRIAAVLGKDHRFEKLKNE